MTQCGGDRAGTGNNAGISNAQITVSGSAAIGGNGDTVTGSSGAGVTVTGVNDNLSGTGGSTSSDGASAAAYLNLINAMASFGASGDASGQVTVPNNDPTQQTLAAVVG